VHLTKEEESAYDGEHGWANQVCMKILVRLGELFGAKKLIPIRSAHVSGVSYKTLGDAPIEFLKALADDHAKVKVRSTLNPQGSDPEYLEKRLDSFVRTRQAAILGQFEKMGFTQSMTCTPYHLEKPSHGSHVAWAESSAVVYANSVLGAWTNREGGPSALAAAIVGKTPDYGVHQAENRQPKVLVNVNARLRNETDYGVLGAFLGRHLADRTPLIKGVENAPKSCLKQLGAALASTGMVNMFHTGRLGAKEQGLEKINVVSKDLMKTADSLSTASASKPDLVFIGCPHCSLNEMRHIAQLTQGNKVKAGMEFWVCTSRCVKDLAKEYTVEIERSGGHVLAGVCTVVSWTEKLGIKTIMTNSAKTAYYAPTLNKAETILAPLEQCLRAVLEG
jgi:hypothetical protein